ncbi:40s ribosomal protein s5-1 [Hordeum vulgare]|nr:40s ribosomal protein s5-1 [Hordeum vulgare]
METRLEAMEQQVYKCQGMVERGVNANHMMIMEFTSNHKMDAIDIGKHLSRLYDRVDQLQGQIYDLQNQTCDSWRICSIGCRKNTRTPKDLPSEPPGSPGPEDGDSRPTRWKKPKAFVTWEQE